MAMAAPTLPPLLPALSMCASTAVVGSSALLLRYELGAQIDNHTCVFRVNHAPTSGFEVHVGNRTTHRTIGPAILHVLERTYYMN
eukprot:2078239-Pleurochrysis_carterae.AAC.2